MAQISKESIEKVLEATDIVELIGSYIPVKRAGSQFKANCPFHHEKTPSFYVTPSRQTFHCFGCGKGGDAISFVRDYENLPFTEAVRKLASRAGIPLVEEQLTPEMEKARHIRGRLLDLHREAAAFFHDLLLKDPAARHAREYLKSRGFGREMAGRWTVGWMPENPRQFLDWAKSRKYLGRELVASGMASLRDEAQPARGLYVRFRDRLMFPIRNEIGDVIAFSGRQLKHDPNTGKYINSPETAIFKKSNVMFALDRSKKAILKEKAVLICEGQIDAIACHELGIENAIAPLGTALTAQHARLLKRYAGNVILSYDADRAGLAAAERAFRELAAEGLDVRVVEMPEGHDPDTYTREFGAEAFRSLMAEAKEFFDFKLERAKASGGTMAAADRTALTNDCAGLLALMGDHVARDQQINVVANHLQTSASSLREAIARISRRNKKPDADPAAGESREKTEPTPLHRISSFLCHLALTSAPAQHFLGEQFETIHEAAPWLDGINLLETILGAAPDPTNPAAVNAFLSGLKEADRLALMAEATTLAGSPEDGVQAAEHALSLLSGTVLQRRDAAVKAALKQPGLSHERMIELLQEAKEIRALLQGTRRSEFDDELPASTFKPKPPPWKWRNREIS
ncbi:MAG: DNA primase [Luteolibacter sp.]